MSSVLYFLMGPTAVGKTDLSLEWAERMGAEIVSCDSLLFYRGMDIGTAKPTEEERRRVPHHLIDVAPVDQPVNLPQYLNEVERVVQEIGRRGRQVLIVGGSGFYLHSFFQPWPQQLPERPDVRAELETIQRKQGLAGLLQELDRRHPEGTSGLDRNNPHRVFNALLRSRLLGLSWEEMRANWENQPLPFANWEKRLVCMGRPDEELFPRIEQRVQQMLEKGLADEVERLRKQGIENNPTARTAIGYREILQNPNGPHQLWLEEIVLHTRQLVRKQQKWFRNKFRQIPVEHPDSLISAVCPQECFHPWNQGQNES